MTEQPLFPPTARCLCGCRGKDHETVWQGDIFKGTRCKAHGGHKWALDTLLSDEEYERRRQASQ